MSKQNIITDCLEDTISILQRLEEDGNKICKCKEDYICKFCNAKKVLYTYQLSMRENIGISNYEKLKVHCITTEVWFKNFAEAGKHYNINPSNIAKCCYGELKSAGKFAEEKLVWELKRHYV